jgi:MFS family permease
MRILGLDKNISLCMGCCLLSGFALGLSQLLVPLYTLNLSDSPTVLALVVGSFPLTSFLMSLVSGAFGDYFGRRSVMIAAFASMASGCLAFAAAKTVVLLLVGQTLLACGTISSYIAVLAVLLEVGPPDPDRDYAMQGLATGTIRIGSILGPLVGGFVSARLGFQVVFLLGAVLTATGSVLATRLELRAPTREAGGSLVHHVFEYHKAAFRLLYRNPAVRLTNALHVVATFSWAAMGSSFYLVWLAASGLSAADVGLVRGGHLLVATLCQLSLGYVSTKVSAWNLSVAAIIVGALALGVTPLLRGSFLIAAMALLGGISWIYMPALVGLATEHLRNGERSMAIALFNVTWGLTNPAALLALGLVVENASLSSAFFVSGSVAVLGSGVLWIWGNSRWPQFRSRGTAR